MRNMPNSKTYRLLQPRNKGGWYVLDTQPTQELKQMGGGLKFVLYHISSTSFAPCQIQNMLICPCKTAHMKRKYYRIRQFCYVQQRTKELSVCQRVRMWLEKPRLWVKDWSSGRWSGDSKLAVKALRKEWIKRAFGTRASCSFLC